MDFYSALKDGVLYPPPEAGLFDLPISIGFVIEFGVSRTTGILPSAEAGLFDLPISIGFVIEFGVSRIKKMHLLGVHF
jgi:hypothetical protein